MKTHVSPILVVAFVAALVLAPLAHAGDASKVVGVWDLIASTPNGDLPSLLTITEAGGELEAEISVDGMARNVTDPKMEGDVFQMTVHVDGVPYDVEANLDGDSFEGTWSGTEASGTLKGTRQP
jgi:hypothetical protein